MKKSQLKQPLVLSIALILFAGIVIYLRSAQAAFIAAANSAGQDAAAFSVEAVRDMDGAVPLAGTWEYYPDVLLYSENAPKDLEPIYICVPVDTLSSDISGLSRTGKGSFRAVLTGTPDMGENNLMLYLYDFLADYDVYIDGVPQHKLLPPPNSNQIYAINKTGDVEIVIEVSHCPQGLNVVPHFSYVRMPMLTSDNIRNVSLLLLAIFLVVFIMFLMFFSSSLDREMRPVFLYGLALTITYAVNVSWALGQDANIQKVLAFSFLRPIILTLELLVVQMAFWLFYREYRSEPLKRMFFAESALMLLSWTCLVINSAICLSRPLHILGLVFLLSAVAIWVFTIYKTMLRYQTNCLLLSLVLLAVLTAVTINMLQWHVSIWSNVPFYVLPGSIGIYLVYCFYKYRIYKRMQIQKMEALLETEKLVTRTQAALLASQIQPHFLSNTLLTIQNLCKKDPDQASDLIVRFSNYLRHNIDFMNYTELVPFEKELEHIDNFIYIQKVRFQDTLTFRSEIRYQDFEIPPLTIQPIVENAIKHGVRNSYDGGTVLLKVWKDAAFIHILVQNDAGPPFDPNTARLRSLHNIQQRLKNLRNASMEIHGLDPEGTSVEIVFLDRDEQNAALNTAGKGTDSAE